tara:strand:- start:95 stop:376 length:282 start_codon:yes stop_codon:yes gene_type:complete
MLYYIVIGICIALLFSVIYFSIKPISMGIEARRNLNNKISKSDDEKNDDVEINQNLEENNILISDEIIRLNNLKKDGLLTEEEFEKAKEKLLN